MSWQSDIFDAIQGNAALTELIGDRFSWDIADGSTATPYLVAQVVSGSGETNFDGNRPDVFPLIQLTAWATGKASAIAIIATLKSEIEGKDLPGANNVSLGYSGENSTYDRTTRLYGEIIDYRISALSN